MPSPSSPVSHIHGCSPEFPETLPLKITTDSQPGGFRCHLCVHNSQILIALLSCLHLATSLILNLSVFKSEFIPPRPNWVSLPFHALYLLFVFLDDSGIPGRLTSCHNITSRLRPHGLILCGCSCFSWPLTLPPGPQWWLLSQSLPSSRVLPHCPQRWSEPTCGHAMCLPQLHFLLSSHAC